MVLEPGGIVAWLLVGLMACSLSTQFMSGRGYGAGRDVGIGVLGALLGGFAVGLLGVQGQERLLVSMLAAFVGAVLLTGLARGLPGRPPA
jgi:uncharacterized membrane protein YeaQ/YmgE (transglycosylase-associated protein family)